MLHSYSSFFSPLCSAFECFRVHRYDVHSRKKNCPAFCSIRGVVERNEGCKQDSQTFINRFDEVTAMSPKNNSCDSNTYRAENEICIYNISMNCEADYISVSQSHLNLAPNDFLQVIELTRQDPHPKVYTSTNNGKWPRDWSKIYSNDFLLVFWTEEDSKEGYNGFKVGFECPAGENTDKSSTDGSGSLLSGLLPS